MMTLGLTLGCWCVMVLLLDEESESKEFLKKFGNGVDKFEII